MYPAGSGAAGFIDFAVYSLTGGSSDPYGIGVSASALTADGFDPTSKYLYLFQNVNLDKDISQSTVALDAPATGSGDLAGKGFSGVTATTPTNGQTEAAASSIATPQSPAVTGQTWTVTSVASLINPSSVSIGLTSVQATFSTNLGTGSKAVSSLWGYTTNYAPTFDTGSIQDHGTSGVGTVPAALTPEPSSLVLAGFGALGLIGYGIRRRKGA